METYQLELGTINVCTPEEARELWKSRPDERATIWSVEEFDKHILSDPETIENVMAWKRNKPGSYL